MLSSNYKYEHRLLHRPWLGESCACFGDCQCDALAWRQRAEDLGAENVQMRAALNQMIDASEVGSASDAIQDMLDIARKTLDATSG